MRRRAARLARCAALAAVAAAGVVELWRVHPATAVGSDPDAGIVTGCAWVFWAVAGYLVLAVLLAVLAAAVEFDRLARWTPPPVRRVVETVVSMGLIGALSGAGVAAAADRVPEASRPHRPPVVTSLDWPGLGPTDAAPAAHAPPIRFTTTVVVVRPGDSLWTIAARHLGPRATAAQIAAAWPRWWRANRAVIGPDPSLIRPGLHLTAPMTDGSPH